MKASELIQSLQVLVQKNGDHIIGAYNGVYADIIEKEDIGCMELIGEDKSRYNDTHIIVLYNNEPDNVDW